MGVYQTKDSGLFDYLNSISDSLDEGYPETPTIFLLLMQNFVDFIKIGTLVKLWSLVTLSRRTLSVGVFYRYRRRPTLTVTRWSSVSWS